jgi:anti-sigma factor RsiW
MEADLHDLTAAYALDALDPEEAREYEAHLARCERCRNELASLSEAAGALAYAAEAPVPPTELRARILQQAQRERPNVVPLRPRRPRLLAAVAAAAAVAACVAVGLGVWAASLSNKLDRRDAQLRAQEQVAAILAEPSSRTISFGRGALVVGRNGEAALVVHNLKDPPTGKTYEAWISAGGAPRPAGTFEGGEIVSVPLDGAVEAGASVLVTVERDGGVDAPTRKPFLSVQS